MQALLLAIPILIPQSTVSMDALPKAHFNNSAGVTHARNNTTGIQSYRQAVVTTPVSFLRLF